MTRLGIEPQPPVLMASAHHWATSPYCGYDIVRSEWESRWRSYDVRRSYDIKTMKQRCTNIVLTSHTSCMGKEI